MKLNIRLELLFWMVMYKYFALYLKAKNHGKKKKKNNQV